MKKMKSYLVLTSLPYRILMFAVLPVVFLLADFFMIQKGMSAILSATLLCFVEIMMDNWLFCGIQSKNAIKMDYLKSSSYGMKLIGNGLWMDQIRRFVETALLLLICFGMELLFQTGSEAKPAIMDYLVMLLCVYLASALGVFVTRFGEQLWLNWLVAYVLFIGAVGLFSICCMNRELSILVLLVAAIAAASVSVRVAERKVKEGYYDERIKNGN